MKNKQENHDADTPSLLNQSLGGRVNRCFGCGPANEHGLKLRFSLDHEAGTSTAKVKLARRYEGPPGHIHGGIIATLLDEAMGKVNKIHNVVAMTRHIEIDYLRPSPLSQLLTVTGRFLRRDGRKMFMESEIHDAAGKLLVRGKGLFIVIDPAAFFAKHSKERVSAACPVAVPAPKARAARKQRVP
ncbi:MAG TPA: PaaI family thioesterase [Acidobacteriaceae bacterium]|nr:PaaI family thioesterase [Acidobacteriaceae bacterium]